jgi:hypothetical protein
MVYTTQNYWIFENCYQPELSEHVLHVTEIAVVSFLDALGVMFSNPYVSYETLRCVSIGINPWQHLLFRYPC